MLECNHAALVFKTIFSIKGITDIAGAWGFKKYFEKFGKILKRNPIMIGVDGHSLSYSSSHLCRAWKKGSKYGNLSEIWLYLKKKKIPAATTVTGSMLREGQLEGNTKASKHIFTLSKTECIFPYYMWQQCYSKREVFVKTQKTLGKP